jgi:hypothetical protein
MSMKRAAALLAACVLVGITVGVNAGQEIVSTVSSVESAGFLPDGTPFMTVSWGLLGFDIVVTGKAVHFPTSGKGHNLTDGTGRSRSQSFTLDWFTGQLLDRHRSSGSLELIRFDDGTGTLDAVFVITHEVFGTADQVLAIYPWAVPQGSGNGKGWWLWIIEIQSYTPISPP